MNTRVTEHVIDNEGVVWRETRVREEVVIDERVKKALASGDIHKRTDVAMFPGYGTVDYCHNPKDNTSYWTVNVSKILFRCEAKTITEPMTEKKVIVPNFIYQPDSKAVVELPWLVGAAYDALGCNAIVKLVVAVNENCETVRHFLFAFNEKGAAFRLPIANLFDTCELCNGEYSAHGECELEAVAKAIKQFEAAQWISAPGSREQNLYDNDSVNNTEHMIRFEATKDGFTTLPMDCKDWTTLCQKVSIETLNYVV